MNERPSRFSLIRSAGLVRGPQGRSKEVACRDRLARRGERRALGERLLQVVQRDAQAAAQPFDAAVHRLVDPARVLEEGARPFARAEQGQGEIETYRDPATISAQRLTERRHRVLVAAEPELAPPDELPQIFLRFVSLT